MDSITRVLCEKYTDLSGDEIACIEKYSGMIQALANAEQADVFIDCCSSTGRTAIVVSEAKPQTALSNYSIPILGMMIQWKDEPAVERSFKLGVPTVGVRAVSMPEDRRIIQTVEPIFCAEKLIGVLIYEKAADAGNLVEPAVGRTPGMSQSKWSAVSDYLEDAVIFLNEDDIVCGYNRKASELYKKLGYICDIMGMPLSNIQPFFTDEGGPQPYEACMANHILRYRRISLAPDEVGSALIIQDISQRRQLEQDLMLQRMLQSELKHRVKNHLWMISNLILHKMYEISDPADTRSLMLDTASRILSIASTLDGIVQTSEEKISLRRVFEQIRKYTLQTLAPATKTVTIHLPEQDLEVSAEIASIVALVVNELVQNAFKYAFSVRSQGVITIGLEADTPFCKISVSDDGVGFPPDSPSGGGLAFAESIVRKKLLGEWELHSDPHGTKITFDFVIK